MADRTERREDVAGFNLPNAIDVERLVLGSLLGNTDRDDFQAVGDLLTEQDFALEKHRLLYRAMRDQHEKGYGSGIVPIYETLKERGHDKHVGGLTYLSAISAGAPKLFEMGRYCQIILQKSTYRKAMMMASDILARCSQQTDSPDDLIVEAQKLVQIFGETQRDGLHTIGDVIARGGGLNDFVTGKAKGEIAVPWLFQSVQTTTGGMFGSELTILAARPGIGKSATAIQQCCYASSLGIRTACYVMEMSDSEVVKRLISQVSDVSGSKWRLGEMNQYERDSISSATTELVSLDENFLLSDEANVTTAKIATDLRKWKTKGKPIQFVMVDYLQLMGAVGKFQNREQEVSNISRGLKLLAQEFKIPVLALCQLRREAEDRPDRRPELRDLRESGSIEQNANVVMFEWWPKPNSEEKISDINWAVSKQRNGPLNEGVFQFNKRVFRFEDPFGMAEVRLVA